MMSATSPAPLLRFSWVSLEHNKSFDHNPFWPILHLWDPISTVCLTHSQPPLVKMAKWRCTFAYTSCMSPKGEDLNQPPAPSPPKENVPKTNSVNIPLSTRHQGLLFFNTSMDQSKINPLSSSTFCSWFLQLQGFYYCRCFLFLVNKPTDLSAKLRSRNANKNSLNF